MQSALHEKAIGCIVGAAVGDALGGATEGWSPQQIRERWHGWVTGVVPPYYPDWRNAPGLSRYHKGDGHVTDDTLMTGLLIDVYCDKRDHLDAYDMAERLVPRMISGATWVPELEDSVVPLHRLFLAEKYLAFRTHWAHVDPREAGVGNAVNCGAAMYMAPVGVVNAGDPARAYFEAIDMAGAHQQSYGREAAGVMAAAVAAAMTPGATVTSVVDAALLVAHDGTRAAIEAVTEAARGCSDWMTAIESGVLRDAMRPFDTVADTYREQGLGARRPSRLHSIEELPLALAFLVIGAGDFRDSVLGAVNYGRDADSIATMVGALVGAMFGASWVPHELEEQVSVASRIDLRERATRLADVAFDIRLQDRERASLVARSFDDLNHA